jgi:hypothetical protein
MMRQGLRLSGFIQGLYIRFQSAGSNPLFQSARLRPLHLQPYRPHQLQRVALLHHPRPLLSSAPLEAARALLPRIEGDQPLTAARALDFLRPLRTSAPLDAVRALLPRIEGDQPLTAAIERVEELIAEAAVEGLA